ncbi:MAG TPA: sigma-70 family RNA polymerase sigma factor [Solirubrobacterales bacterium]|nr:sigma-70 family RNA polymerase sigma factor [Solirubrobacterales bacterium]
MRTAEAWDWQEVHATCLRSARRYAHRAAEVEDVAQEAALRAWRRRSSLRDSGKRHQWLDQITRNEALRLAGRDRSVLVPEPEGWAGVEDQGIKDLVDRADIDRALSALNLRERRLIELRYGADLTQPAIAARLGMPEGTIKVGLHRARAKLRRALQHS